MTCCALLAEIPLRASAASLLLRVAAAPSYCVVDGECRRCDHAVGLAWVDKVCRVCYSKLVDFTRGQTMVISWRALGWVLGLSSVALWGLAYLTDDTVSYMVSSVFSVGVIATLMLDAND